MQSIHARTIGPFLGSTALAYFSMEMALRPEMHTYSGGLGVLAGDRARSCADLEIPIVFVTLISRQGYLRQEISPHGDQIEHADPWTPEDFASPLRAKVAVLIEGREVWVRPWLYVLTSATGQACQCCCSIPTCMRMPPTTGRSRIVSMGATTRIA